MAQQFRKTFTFEAGNNTGSQGVLQIAEEPVNFTAIFQGTPLFYPGSVIEVQEVMTIISEVVQPIKVDIDLRWFSPKKYLGTYQILSTVGLPNHRDGDDGFLVDTIQEVVRYSRYVIVANPDVPIGIYGGQQINACNFKLQQVTFVSPGFEVSESSLERTNAVFLSQAGLAPVPLIDTQFNQLIGGIGLYFNAGVIGKRIEYTIAIINTISTDLAAFPVSSCSVPPDACTDNLNNFIAQAPNDRFATVALAQSFYNSGGFANQAIIEPRSFPCGDGTNRTYFVIANQQG